MKKRTSIGRATLKKRAQVSIEKLKKSINSRPLHFFYGSLIVFVALIIIGNVLRKPAPEAPEKVQSPEIVEVYRLGGDAQVTVTGEIEKSGVVTVVALTPGIVNKINFREGASVSKGTILMNLATNYQGGNASRAQRQIAGVQYQNILDTYETQKTLIAKQKESAEKLDEQSDDLRNLTDDSLSETKNLIDLNSSIISKLDSQLSMLEADPVTNADVILATKQAKSQFLSVQNQVQSGYRQSQYQSSGENAPAELSNLSRELAVNQLDLQLKMLDVTKEISRLQLSLARISEGMMTPASPFRGVVQRVFVKEGQMVNPGTPLAIVSQAVDDPITLVAYVSRDISQKISTTKESDIIVHNETISLKPHFISTDSVADGLYAVYFALPDSFILKVTDNDHAVVRLNLSPTERASDSVSINQPYIPIDAVHQTANSAYVFVAQNGQAASKKVTLGGVFGSLIQASGLSTDDVIILNRDVTQGTRVQISQK